CCSSPLQPSAAFLMLARYTFAVDQGMVPLQHIEDAAHAHRFGHTVFLAQLDPDPHRRVVSTLTLHVGHGLGAGVVGGACVSHRIPLTASRDHPKSTSVIRAPIRGPLWWMPRSGLVDRSVNQIVFWPRSFGSTRMPRNGGPLGLVAANSSIHLSYHESG